MMKQLLIEEMKRAIELMDSKEELETFKHIEDGRYSYSVIDREVSELKMLLLAIRKHSILLEKEIK